jgi:hypothetical protein
MISFFPLSLQMQRRAEDATGTGFKFPQLVMVGRRRLGAVAVERTVVGEIGGIKIETVVNIRVAKTVVENPDHIV